MKEKRSRYGREKKRQKKIISGKKRILIKRESKDSKKDQGKGNDVKLEWNAWKKGKKILQG